MVITTVTFGPVETNGYVVVDEVSRHCAIIDPGMDSEPMLDLMLKEGWKADLIVNTHGHWDHVYSNALFVRETGAALALHADDVHFLEGLEDQCFWMGIEPGEPSPKPDRVLSDGDRLAIGEVEAEVLHTPGHSPGGICLHFPVEGVLLSGDALFAGSIGRTDLPGGNHDQLIHAIRTKLFVLPGVTKVYAGHGPVTTIGEEKRANPFVS